MIDRLSGYKATIMLDKESPQPYQYLGGIEAGQEFSGLKECAMLRLYEDAILNGKMQEDDLQMVHFVNSNGANMAMSSEFKGPVNDFYRQMHKKGLPIFPVGFNQNMSVVGKQLVSKYPIKEFLAKMFDQEFSDVMDRNKWNKIIQLALQPGTLDIEPYNARVYIDEKIDSEDGVIFVNPAFWATTIRPAYQHLFARQNAVDFIDLIKINSANSDLVLKGVMQRAHASYWDLLMHRIGRGNDQQSVDIVLCGHAIKYNKNFTVGKIYELTQDRFAFHNDSSVARGTDVNVSKQVIVRSGCQAETLYSQVLAPVIEHIRGILNFEEKPVLEAIGMLNSRDEYDDSPNEVTLERASALQTRIIDHGLPANHPANAAAVLDLAMVTIRQRLNRIRVEGFHGMGGISPVDEPGKVFISKGIFDRWINKHGSCAAYLFRMPYLGNYCGRHVEISPADTDSILIHNEDARQMEGDFDGDQYYLVPVKYLVGISEGTKPPRPAKRDKEIIPLDDVSLLAGMFEITDAKMGIGLRDHTLSTAYDYLIAANANGDWNDMERFGDVVKTLQVWVQQAVEGIKHSNEGILTNDQIGKLLPSRRCHPLTKLFTNTVLNKTKVYTIGHTKGYLDLVKEAVKEEDSWHPLYGIFAPLSELEIGTPSEGIEYWNVVANPVPTVVDAAKFNDWVVTCMRLKKMYTSGIARWAGGENRNVVFKRDVIGPIAKIWEKALDDYQNQPGAIIDLHLALAHVAYKPTPNNQLQNQLRSMKTSSYTTVDEYEIEGVEHYDNRTLISSRTTYVSPAASVSTKKWLPSSGSLFHHLAIADVARWIFRNVGSKLQPGEFEEELIQGLEELRASF